jgi:hypothetical protein
MFPWFSQGKGDIHLLAAGVTHADDRSEWAEPSKSGEWTSRKGGDERRVARRASGMFVVRKKTESGCSTGV